MHKLIIFLKIGLAAIVFLLFGLLLNCKTSNETKVLAVNQSFETNRISKNMPNPTPTVNQQIETPDLSDLPTVTYCELIKNPMEYDHKIVRLRAIYFTDFEKTYLYDETCQQNKPPSAPEKVPAETWAEWDKTFVSKGDSDEAKLNRGLNGFGRKDVNVIGRFFSTNKNSDRDAPNLFGHLNCCKFQFLIMRAEKITVLTK